MYIKIGFIYLIFICGMLIFPSAGHTQCNPAPIDNCDETIPVCGLNLLNGLCCTSTTFVNPTGCTPLCPSGGTPTNTSWWAFKTNGGNASIIINFNNCSVTGQGLQMGIWGDCNCSESVACNTSCNGPGSYSISAVFESCKTYYLFINGCGGDVCDYCLTTSGGTPPVLPPLVNIVGPRDVCEGACIVKYSVNFSGNCDPYFKWTLDGNELNFFTREINLDFPEERDYILCVTANIGGQYSGPVCDQEGPLCITIKCKRLPDKVGPPWTLCHELIPFIWHSRTITESGIYTQQFTERTGCCKFDSVREFVVLDFPEIPEVFHLGCSVQDAYVDPMTKLKFNSCVYNKPVILKKSTSPYKCDSAYLLNAVFLNLAVDFQEYCDSGSLYLIHRITDSSTICDFTNELNQVYTIRWYLKSDSLKKTIGLDDSLLLTRKDSYCLEIIVDAWYGVVSKKCSFNFCEEFDEDDFMIYEICPEGKFESVEGDTLEYNIDTALHSRTTNQNWFIEGGRILTPDGGKDTNKIYVLWDQNTSKRFLCYQYLTDCGESKKCCQEVKIVSGEKENSWTSIQLIPNPADDKILIQCEAHTEFELVELLDHFGKKVQQWNKPEGLLFDLSEIPAGVYYLQLHSEEQILIKKLLVY